MISILIATNRTPLASLPGCGSMWQARSGGVVSWFRVLWPPELNLRQEFRQRLLDDFLPSHWAVSLDVIVDLLRVTGDGTGEAVRPLLPFLTDGGHLGLQLGPQLLTFGSELSQTFGREIGLGHDHSSPAR